MTTRTGILAAMEEELEILLHALELEEKTEQAGVRFYTGKLDGTPVVLGECGIGKVNAALATTLMLHIFSPSVVLNTGTAGGLRDEYDVGDIVLGEAVSYHDVDATAFGYVYGQVPREPATFAADPTLLSSALQAGKDVAGVSVRTGLIASGDVFLGDVQARELVRSRFPNVGAVEMEAAAIAQVCYHFNIPCLIVRAVSDLAGNDARMTHEEFLHIAADNSARLVMATLKKYYDPS